MSPGAAVSAVSVEPLPESAAVTSTGRNKKTMLGGFFFSDSPVLPGCLASIKTHLSQINTGVEALKLRVSSW